MEHLREPKLGPSRIFCSVWTVDNVNDKRTWTVLTKVRAGPQVQVDERKGKNQANP